MSEMHAFWSLKLICIHLDCRNSRFWIYNKDYHRNTESRISVAFYVTPANQQQCVGVPFNVSQLKVALRLTISFSDPKLIIFVLNFQDRLYGLVVRIVAADSEVSDSIPTAVTFSE
jgi:hypothetical protein